MRSALDHHFSSRIAAQLRGRRHDVVAVVEQGWDTEDDEPLLALCESEHLALVTNNVADFVAIARRWATQGRRHSGLIFTSDASMPRHQAAIGRYVEALDGLLRANPGPEAFADRVHWLSAGAEGGSAARRRRPAPG